MLDELHIQNVALIKDAWLVPSESFTAITGESGSGKTALVNALKLLVGARSEASMVREGATELKVEGRFFFEDELPSENGAEEASTHLAVRTVSAKGRSRVYVDGAMASIKELAQGLGASVDLCGQHEHQQLMNVAHQRQLLDKWGEETIEPALRAYQTAFENVQQAQDVLAQCQADMQANEAQLEETRFMVHQIAEVNPQAGEYETLLEELPRYENAELLLGKAALIRTCLQDEGAALEQIEQVVASLEETTRIDSSLASLLEQARDAYFTLEDVAREVSSYALSVDYSAEELEQRQNRVAQFQLLMRSYGPRMEDVLEHWAQGEAFLNRFESRDELLAQAKEYLEEAERTLARAAHDLARARQEALPSFVQAVNVQLVRLEMGSAHIEGCFEDLPREKWTKQGSQAFELMFAPAQDMKLQKLNHIASGGEVSRVMLAIKVVMGDKDDVDTLVFDEIDAGVGGQTAVALAQVLQDLAQTHQVIVVTHLPQVAACADKQYCVTKQEDVTGTGLPETALVLLEGAAREEEIARMLSGAVTPTSCAHAQELLRGVL